MLVFLKLGGSLITDKTRPYTPRPKKLDDLSDQIASALNKFPDLRLVLGHGSGSFGHEAASQFDTRGGVSGVEAWHGFTEVWYQASALNRLVTEALLRAGVPALTISPLSGISTRERKGMTWDLNPIRAALDHHLLPVVHGDVVFDDVLGGTILSTEELFVYLGRQLRPGRILLAGLEAGVWEDFPTRRKIIPEITPINFPQKAAGLGPAAGKDVTGGMRTKVSQMLELVKENHGLEVLIFSGEEAGNVYRALAGENLGTCLHI
jgi:isopentenyl phosphate kinase